MHLMKEVGSDPEMLLLLHAFRLARLLNIKASRPVWGMYRLNGESLEVAGRAENRPGTLSTLKKRSPNFQGPVSSSEIFAMCHQLWSQYGCHWVWHNTKGQRKRQDPKIVLACLLSSVRGGKASPHPFTERTSQQLSSIQNKWEGACPTAGQ